MNAEETTEHKKPHSPPYVAFKTFGNFVNSLKITLPGRIDRSVMHTMSGGAQSHIMASLRSMDLISGHGIPTEVFRELVNSEGEARKKALLSAIKIGFPFLFDGSIDLSSATGKQLLERFDSAPLTGNTLRRSVAFFLAAAKDAGLNLSPYFSKIQSRSGTPVKRQPANGTSSASATFDEDDEKVEKDDLTPPLAESSTPPSAGESLTVNLKSGGILTVSASTSFFKMSGEDRGFVFEIIDRLQQYVAAGRPSL